MVQFTMHIELHRLKEGSVFIVEGEKSEVEREDHGLEGGRWATFNVLHVDNDSVDSGCQFGHNQLLAILEEMLRAIVVIGVKLDDDKVDVGAKEVTADFQSQIQIISLLKEYILIVEYLELAIVFTCRLDICCKEVTLN